MRNVDDSDATFGIRGTFFDTVANPFHVGDEQALRYVADGLMVVRNGRIAAFDDYRRLSKSFSGLRVVDHRGKKITHGLGDCHSHAYQYEIQAAPCRNLLHWLDTNTFPAELRVCQDKDYARIHAAKFLRRTIEGGTTAVMAFGTHSQDATDALLESADALGKLSPQIISGMAVADSLLPQQMWHSLRQTRLQNHEIIERWHGANDGRILVSLIRASPPPHRFGN